MILKEFGIKKLFKKIFNELEFPKDINETSKYFEGKVEYLNLSEEGKAKVEDFFFTFTEFDLEIFCAIMSINSYKHVSETFEIKINEYIKKHKNLIFEELDKIEIDKNDINKVNVQIYESIKNTKKINTILLHNICSLAIYKKDLFKVGSYWGLFNLFTYVSVNFHEDFINWYFNTTREDLKIVFTSIIFTTYSIFEYATPELSKSSIVYIRAISKIIEYNLDRTICDTYFKKTFIDLDKDEEENLLFVLYSYRYKNDDEITNEDFKKVSSFSKFFTKEILEQFLNEVISKRLLISFLLSIEEINKREELLKEFAIHINKLINEDKIIFTDRFLSELDAYAILINNSIYSLDYVESLENEFKFICDNMNKPYSYYKESESWQNNIKILVNYLIVLSAVKNYDINELYNLYKRTKKQFNIFQENEINNILKQVIK
jgi:hypothetical protein